MDKPLVTLIISALDEASILEKHLRLILKYLDSHEEKYRWECIFINDGSHDRTGEIMERIRKEDPRIRIIHHEENEGLGASLQDGFKESRGDYVITWDIDLSTSIDMIEKLLEHIQNTQADVVVGSPTMEGGKIENVPPLRIYLSRFANSFLSLLAPVKISNLTCMIRVYDGDFIRAMNLNARGMEIMPEILRKAMILKGKIEQVPITINWSPDKTASLPRKSRMRVLKHTMAIFFSGFLFRPFIFFILPGLLLLLFSIYPNMWMFIHYIEEYNKLEASSFLTRSSEAIRSAYQLHPHTFIIALLSLLLSIQLLALGVQSMQTKHYFEEIFSLVTKDKLKGRKKK